MKRIWTIIGLAVAVAMGGCSRESVERTDGPATDGRIGFSTPDLATRGTAITTIQQLAYDGFYVWAYVHTGAWTGTAAAAKTPLLTEEHVTSTDNGNTWTYQNTAEWPDNSDYVSFFSYAPAGAVTEPLSYDSHGTPVIEFTVDDQVADQIDLFIASDLSNQKGYEYTLNDDKVGLHFKHALSQIKFSASYASEKMTPTLPGEVAPKVKLTNLVLKNVYNSGTVPMTSPIVWTPTGTTTDYDFSIEDDTLEDIELDGEQRNVIPADLGSLFLIPQPVVGRTVGDMEIEVTFDIDGGTLSYSSPIVMPDAGWLPGKSYDYQIALTDEGIKVIVIDNSLNLDPWGTSIVLQTVMLSSEAAHDQANINSTLALLNYISVTGSGTTYNWFGIYGVNDVNHNITINIGALGLNSFRAGQHIILDFKKTVRTWGNDGTNPYTLSVTSYGGWSLADAKQTYDFGSGLYQYKDEDTGEYVEIDGISGATLPLDLYNRESDPIYVKTVQPSASISAKGSIILVKD